MRVGTAVLLCALSMTAAARDASVSRAAQRIHGRALTLDTHLDTAVHLARPGWSILERHSAATDISQVDLPRMRAGGLDGGFWAIYVGQGERNPAGYARARDAALRIAIRLRELTLREPAQFGLALTADDAPRIHGEGRRVLFLSIENAYPLGQDLSLLRTFHELGVRLFGPVHFLNNDFGDSATDPKGAEWGGLSPRRRHGSRGCVPAASRDRETARRRLQRGGCPENLERQRASGTA